MEFRLSDFVESFLHLEAKPFSLKDYPHMRLIYDIDPAELVLHTSRQVAKSTTLANIMLARMILMPQAFEDFEGGFRILSVSPTVEQVRVFSYDRIDPVIEQSPIFKKYFVNSSMIQNVFQKRFLNGSVLYLRYGSSTADRIRGISAAMNCFDSNTEILTENGWKLFKDLIDTEKVATLNPDTNNVEFHIPDYYIKKPFSGKLISFKHRSFVLNVTPDHLMNVSQELATGYYKNPKVKGWNNVAAKTLLGKNFKMGIRGNWENKNVSEFVIPEYTVTTQLNGKPYRSPRKIKEFRAPIKPFMEFMGWYLSEGHTAKTGHITISQNDGIFANEIKLCLTKLGVKFGISKAKTRACNSFYFASPALSRYLHALGKSHDKYIPRELLEYKEHLPLLLDSLYKGDAMHRTDFGHNAGQLNTASKSLANTVQEAWLRLGFLSTIRQVTEKYNGTVMYRIGKLNKTNLIFWNGYTNNSKVEEVDYSGNVYCVGVTNHLIFVRDAKEKTPVISKNCFDECQDIPDDNIGVIEETMARSTYKHKIYAGTPKLIIGPLVNRWKKSTRNEWMVKCAHCAKWNYLDEGNIQPDGLSCRYCFKGMDARNGTWVRTNGTSVKDRETGEYITEGFRISVLMFAHAPWVNWQKDVYLPYLNSSRGLFFNEKLGLSYDTGVSPVTEEEIKACCTGGPMRNAPDRHVADYVTFMGADWGPINSQESKTVMSVLQKRGETIEVLYLKRFEGKEADYAYLHDFIPREYQRWGCQMIGADAGFGEAVNSEIRSRLNDGTRLIAFQHVANQKQYGAWNDHIRAYTLSRNATMTDIFTRIKRKQMIFPRWEDFEPFAQDILAIAIEYSEEKNTYKYIKSAPDDTLHSILYGALAAQIYHNAALAKQDLT